MKKLLIATTNPGKLSEIKYFLSDLPVKLLSLKDLKIKEKIIEDGKTFEENAIKKARFYAKLSGLPTIADDAGLEIDILNGEPGVKSRRWVKGDQESTDNELIEHTLKQLKNVPRKKREAQLRAVLALSLPNGQIFIQEGKIKGYITEKPSKDRTKGFPFRSLFYLPKIKKFYIEKELTQEEEKKLNHRRKALKKLKKIIKSLLIA